MVEEKDELEKRIKEAVYAKTNMNFNVTVKKRGKYEIKALNWSPVFKAVSEETKKEFKEYRGFAYSFHPEPLQIIIKTNLETSNWFWNPKVRRIEKYARAIIEVKRKANDLEDIPYEVVIRDKDGKRVN